MLLRCFDGEDAFESAFTFLTGRLLNGYMTRLLSPVAGRYFPRNEEGADGLSRRFCIITYLPRPLFRRRARSLRPPARAYRRREQKRPSHMPQEVLHDVSFHSCFERVPPCQLPASASIAAAARAICRRCRDCRHLTRARRRICSRKVDALFKTLQWLSLHYRRYGFPSA